MVAQGLGPGLALVLQHRGSNSSPRNSQASPSAPLRLAHEVLVPDLVIAARDAIAAEAPRVLRPRAAIGRERADAARAGQVEARLAGQREERERGVPAVADQVEVAARRGTRARARRAAACTTASCRRTGTFRGRRRTQRYIAWIASANVGVGGQALARRRRGPTPHSSKPGQPVDVGQERLAVGPVAWRSQSCGQEIRLGRDRQSRVAIEHLLEQGRAAPGDAEHDHRRVGRH